MDKNIIKVKSIEQWDSLLKDSKDKLVVANFSESSAQSNTKAGSVFRDMSETYDDAMFVEVDSEDVDDLFDEYDIADTPTFVVLRDGENVGQVLGTNRSMLNKTIKRNYSKPI